MISYSVNENTGIVYAKFSGTITFEELFMHVSINEQNKNFPSKLKLLSDATNARLSIRPPELKQIKNQLAITLEELYYLYDAFVVSKPMETAITTLYMEIARLKKYEFKVFSSMEAAEHWLSRK